MKMPLIGDKFPKMQVQTTKGKIELPNDFKGKWFILFSHPADFTPVCTTEFVAFQKRYKEFTKLNTELIGLSVDQVFSHIKWEEWINDNLKVNIEFPIIADTGKVANTLGLIHPGKGTNTVRAVFIVDPKGVIRTIIYYPLSLGRNFDELYRVLIALQTADEFSIATPADWRPGDDVIVPTAGSCGTAKERMEGKEDMHCYDWFFCTRKLDKEKVLKAILKK